MTGSASVAFGLELWRELRAEFEEYRASAYAAAEEATRGALLNERGRSAGVDAWDLFIGPERRARAYASDELVEFWASTPRLTFAAFEQQRMAERSAMQLGY